MGSRVCSAFLVSGFRRLSIILYLYNFFWLLRITYFISSFSVPFLYLHFLNQIGELVGEDVMSIFGPLALRSSCMFFLALFLTSFPQIGTGVPEGQPSTHCSSPMGSLADINCLGFQWFLDAGLNLLGVLGSSTKMSLLTLQHPFAAASQGVAFAPSAPFPPLPSSTSPAFSVLVSCPIPLFEVFFYTSFLQSNDGYFVCLQIKGEWRVEAFPS